MQTYFIKNPQLFLVSQRKSIEFSMEVNFQQKIMIICDAYCFQFFNNNLLGTKQKYALYSIKEFEHLSKILFFICSVRTIPSIFWMIIRQVRISICTV